MARPKYTEAEARDMVKKELLWRKPIKFPRPRPGGGYYGDSDSESGTTVSEDHSSIQVDEPEGRVCYLLKSLPIEIRKTIYRILFCRTTAFVPGPIRYRCSIGWRNKPLVKIAHIQGIALMGTCKQILSECRAVFYGENAFVFDTRGQDPYPHHRGVHAHDAFERAPHQIPGLPRDDGTINQRNTDRALTHIFDKNARHQPFMSRDPLVKFFRQIGPENACAITKVIIEGFFRTAEENERCRYQRPIGFGRILPIHATILKNVCPNFRKLTLHQGHNNSLWDDDLDGAMGLTDEERVDRTVGQLVNMLPSLQELQLGNYHFVPNGETIVEQWGRSLRWEGIVRARHRQRVDRLAAQERKKRNAAAMKELQQYIWKDEKVIRGGEKPSVGRSGSSGSKDYEKPAAASLRPDAFASLIDKALEEAGMDKKVEENNGDGKAAARPSFRKGKKGKKGDAGLNGSEN